MYDFDAARDTCWSGREIAANAAYHALFGRPIILCALLDFALKVPRRKSLFKARGVAKSANALFAENRAFARVGQGLMNSWAHVCRDRAGSARIGIAGQAIFPRVLEAH